jgi:chromate transport protein ChrA
MTDDNERQAASLRVGISNYVGSASLAVLAGLVALFTYYQQNFRLMVAFYVFMGIATVAIVASMLFGGWGSADVARKVANSQYSKTTTTGAFNTQAILALACVIAAVVAVVCGGLSKGKEEKKSNSLVVTVGVASQSSKQPCDEIDGFVRSSGC